MTRGAAEADRRKAAKLPWLSIALAAVALVASLAPRAGALLEYDRARIGHGEST